ncbi:histidine phosphatase family protein [Streptomyces sp. NPDC058534]|uniref:histidine phosphatase family protein n=1 Tax=Streptomyces sp. NPDC058534 TaxID=3346541 RepID=UPI0036648D77
MSRCGPACAGAIGGVLPRCSAVVRAPSPRCARTARALALTAEVEPALRTFDYGKWRDRTAAEVAATDPYGLSTFLTDPDAVPHGGESVRQLCQRISN